MGWDSRREAFCAGTRTANRDLGGYVQSMMKGNTLLLHLMERHDHEG